jgi:AraC-like DNA-binding protein
VSVPDILANISRGWDREPEGVVLGSAPLGMSAALWTSDFEGTQEVWADLDQSRHIISVPVRTFKATMFFDDRFAWDLPARALTCTMVAAGRKPRAIHSGRYSVLHLYLPTHLANDLARSFESSPERQLEFIDPGCVYDPVIAHVAKEVLSEMREPQGLTALRVDALGQGLAIQLLRRWSNLAGKRSVAQGMASGGLAPLQLKRLTDYMNDRLAEDVSLHDLSLLIGLSTFHLCRAFRQSTGLPPHRWRMQRRLERARELLEGTNMPVMEVAAAVGFDDPSGFAAAFRKALGVSPSHYRRERRS